jgi:hypothetical protein
MSDKLPIIRLAAHIAASVGVSKVINDIISNNTNVATTADAVKVWTGSLVLGSMIVSEASKHVNDRIDVANSWYESRKAEETAA